MEERERLERAIAVLQKWGRRGAIVADLVSKERTDVDRETFMKEVGRRLQDSPDELFS